MNSSRIKNIFKRTLQSSSPKDYISRNLSFKKNKIIIDKKTFEIYGKINVLSFGKASLSMFQGIKREIGLKKINSALIISHIKKLPKKNNKINFLHSSHPFVTRRSETNAKKVIKFVSHLNQKDTLIVLVSGGGSAMLASPVGGISLKQKVNFVSKLLTSGVPEREINEIRKSLSQIKGGALLDYCPSNNIINLILSDERNHKFSAISSGPTIKAKKTNEKEVIRKFKLKKYMTKTIKKFYMERNEKISRGRNKNVSNFLIGSRYTFINDLKKNFLDHGIKKVFILPNKYSNEPMCYAKELCSNYLKFFNKVKKGKYIIISSGEIQVKMKKTNFKGGRNQHLTACMMYLNNFDFKFSFSAFATDGKDFIDGVSGAFFSNIHQKYVQNNKSEIWDYIKKNETYVLHTKLRSIIESKITGHNVSDIFVFFFEKK